MYPSTPEPIQPAPIANEELQSRSRLRLIVILGAVFVAIIMTLSILSVLSHKGKVSVKVVLLPPDSALTVDGQTTKAGSMYLTKTTHTFKATRQYFGPVTRTIDLAAYDTSKVIYLLPDPDTPQADDYLLKHSDIQLQREGVSSANVLKAQNQLDKDKLVPYLPYADPTGGYLVDYGTKEEADGTQQVTIYVESNSDTAKQAALDWIKSRGADPAKLTIVYEPLSADYQPDQGGAEYQG